MEEKIREIRKMEEVLGLAMSLCQSEVHKTIISVEPFVRRIHMTDEAFKKMFGVYDTDNNFSDEFIKHNKFIDGVEFMALEHKPQVEEDDDF